MNADTVAGALSVLAGALAGGGMQYASAARTARAARAERVREERREAVEALAGALHRHRGKLYRRWELRERPAAEREAERWRSWDSRDVVNDARDRLRLRITDPAVLWHADRLVDRSYALGDVDESTTQADIDKRGDEAREADAAFLAAAAEYINSL
ncbi:hypothetical protein ACFU99_32410 [Streptomyces sp. NPDC057654]|uniref:hypothetical protein n=1 Tax=Streptomyces sp. NPDC057654 TaxID=3346196 RepID=UPI0036C2A9B7